MMRSLHLPSSSSSSSSVIFDSVDRTQSKTARGPSTVSCSSRDHSYIPKLQPFSRTKFDRGLKEPPLLQKSENELADYCSTLEGDKAYSCWRAYFELKELENEFSKDDLEMLILQSGGVKSLIQCIHSISTNKKLKNEQINESLKSSNGKKQAEKKPFHIPDGLPKTQEEIDEEEKSKMPDSFFTRLLRTKGKFPAWYSQAPDHETD